MKKKIFLVTLLLLGFIVTGCGSGSSDGGVVNPYAGQYDGVLHGSVEGLGSTFSDSTAYRVFVGADGLVTTCLLYTSPSPRDS